MKITSELLDRKATTKSRRILCVIRDAYDGMLKQVVKRRLFMVFVLFRAKAFCLYKIMRKE
ncbi:MAG: hypothetical protein LUI06_00315 [Ruminococcus sp.]|nr:hypothetical protein [Ruminococcus sp.]